MLKLNSANVSDGIEEQFALQETGGFKNEIRELESLIANLTERNTPAGKANGRKSKKNRSFGFQKLRLRRSNKKKPANAEETKEDFMERVKFLQRVCNDLTARIKEDELANGKSAPEEPDSNMEEARDDDEIMDFRRRVDDEEREREEERDELLTAIVACEKVLSKFSDNTEDLLAVESIESYDNEIEITESKFLATCAEEEAFFAAMEEGMETAETEIEIQLTQSEAAENASSFVCCASDFKIIEIIENLVRHLVGGESQEKMTEEQQEEIQETDRTEEDVGIIAVTSAAAAGESANEAADDEETSALACAFFNMCCLQTTNTDIEPALTFPSPEESQQAKALDEPMDSAKADSSVEKDNEASNYALFNAFSEEEQTLNPNPTPITTDTMSMTVGRPKALGCCEPILVTVCALDDPDLDAYSLAESMKDSSDIREPQESPSRPALVTAKSMETEFTTLETQTIGGKTIETQTVDGKTIGTIDQGLFTSLDSIVGAKKIGNAVKNEDFLDMLVAEDVVTTVVAGAVANAVSNVYDCQACAIESPDLDFLGVGAFTENAVIKPVSTMDFIPRIEVVNTKVKKPSKKKKANQKKTAVMKKKAPVKKAVRKVQTTGTQDLLKLSAMKSAETEGVRNISALKSAETQDIRRIKSINTMDFVPRLEVARFRKKTTAKKATKKTSKKQNNAQSPKKQGTAKKKASNTKKVGKKALAAKKVSTTKRSNPTRRSSGPKKVQKRVPSTNPGRKLSQSEYRRIMAKKRREQRKRDIAKGKQEASGQELDAPKAKARPTKIKHESPESLAQKSINEIPPPDFADLLNFFNPLPPHMREGYLPDPHGDDTASALTEWTPGTGLKEISVLNDEGENKNRWFFQRLKKEEFPDIEESLSPVFSIPNVDTHGTRFDEHDEEYVNNYYSFNENGDEYHPYN